VDEIPPPPREPAPPEPPKPASPPGPSSKATIVAIVASVAVIAVIGFTLALANGGDNAATPSSGATVLPLAAPAGLAAFPSAFKVVVSWAPGEGQAATRFVVSRNGALAATLSPNERRWVDHGVTPETHYVYAVAAVGTDGSTESSRIATTTSTAPVATARLVGTFNVHIHATSHHGFSNFGPANGNLGWRFNPLCSAGPCDTELVDLHAKDFVVKMQRSGATYHGTVTIHGRVKCGGTGVVSIFTVTIQLMDAGSVKRNWVGTGFEGTMTQVEAAQLGCVASGATYQVKGVIVP
jgi:hypothetical protein